MVARGKRLKGARRFVLLLSMIFAVVPAGAGVAQADAGDEVGPLAVAFNGDCESGEFCLFEHTFHRGRVIDYGWAGGRTCDNTYTNNSFPVAGGPVNDQASSWANFTGVTVRIYDDSNYGGTSSDLPPGSADNLWKVSVGQDDASSHRSIGSGC